MHKAAVRSGSSLLKLLQVTGAERPHLPPSLILQRLSAASSYTIRHGPVISAKSSLLSHHSQTRSVASEVPTTGLGASTSRRNNMASTLETLNFDNKALRVLPIDVQDDNYVRQVSGACFSRISPTPVNKPETVAYSAAAMDLVDLSREELDRAEFAEYLSGNKILPGAEPAAHCYCGHQFGNFAGQLGDGATMYLGEVVNKSGQRWEIQFKGAGLTPYSRTADGRKVLRSSIREFLCSEAMHHLGIPTTRAGSCVTSDTKVVRDIYYTGNPIMERATIILRIAQSFIRFGSFEICKPTDPMTGRKGPSHGKPEILEKLLDYVVETFYPEIWEANTADKKAAYLGFYREIVKRTAELVAEWQCVGWCHGVLNTDNMSIVGLTIDYGPYGFMDRFDRSYICNGSDDNGRYAYDQQPDMCKWNLGKLAEAIVHLLPEDEAAPILATYDDLYDTYYMQKMRKKMGLLQKSLPEDSDLVKSFLDLLEETGADMTNSFRLLSRIPLPGGVKATWSEVTAEVTEYFMSQCCTVEELRQANRPQMDPRQLQMFMMLAQMNPDILEQLGQGAATITKEMERIEKFKELKNLTAEKKKEDDLAKWSAWLERYQVRLQQEQEGVADMAAANAERVSVMNANNPRFILRNYIAQNAIAAAEEGDFSEVHRVLRLLETPYSEEVDFSQLAPAPTEGATSTTTDENVTGAATASTSSAADKPLAKPTSCTGQLYDSKPPLWSVDLKVT